MKDWGLTRGAVSPPLWTKNFHGPLVTHPRRFERLPVALPTLFSYQAAASCAPCRCTPTVVCGRTCHALSRCRSPPAVDPGTFRCALAGSFVPPERHVTYVSLLYVSLEFGSGMEPMILMSVSEHGEFHDRSASCAISRAACIGCCCFSISRVTHKCTSAENRARFCVAFAYGHTPPAVHYWPRNSSHRLSDDDLCVFGL